MGKIIIKIRSLWYRLVAKQLLKAIDDYCISLYESGIEIYNLKKEVSQLKLDVLTERERAKLSNNDGAVAAQVVRERLRAGEFGSVLNARDHASSQRIRDLEKEVSKLKQVLREARNN